MLKRFKVTNIELLTLHVGSGNGVSISTEMWLSRPVAGIYATSLLRAQQICERDFPQLVNARITPSTARDWLRGRRLNRPLANRSHH